MRRGMGEVGRPEGPQWAGKKRQPRGQGDDRNRCVLASSETPHVLGPSLARAGEGARGVQRPCLSGQAV